MEGLKRDIQNSGERSKLAAVLVGDDENSKIFLRQKEKACKFIGVDYQLYQFAKNISQSRLEDEVKKIINQNNQGIIIQLPLPKHIDAQKVLNLIPPEKDVDVLSENTPSGRALPPVLAGILELFKEYEIKIKGKNVAVVGKGKLVGEPVSAWMEKVGAKVFVIDKKTRNIASVLKKADIIVSGAGKPNLIKGNMVKRGAVVVDAAGDVDFKSVEPKASYITPIPGGVGPMTVAMLLSNLVKSRA